MKRNIFFWILISVVALASCKKDEPVPMSYPKDRIITYTAFSKLEGITYVYFGNVSILSHTFDNGKGKIIFNGEVTSIGDYAFSGCSGLTSVTIPNSVTSIGESAFQNCTSLTSIVIPNSVTSIGDWTFAWCSSLTSIVIPNSVTSIGEWTFNRCTGLTSIEISNSVTSIGDWAFNRCTGLTSITCKATTPPVCGYDVFNGVNQSIPVYVPSASVSKYKSADVWKDFTNIKGL